MRYCEKHISTAIFNALRQDLRTFPIAPAYLYAMHNQQRRIVLRLIKLSNALEWTRTLIQVLMDYRS